jgi:hypothetical protein
MHVRCVKKGSIRASLCVVRQGLNEVFRNIDECSLVLVCSHHSDKELHFNLLCSEKDMKRRLSISTKQTNGGFFLTKTQGQYVALDVQNESVSVHKR